MEIDVLIPSWNRAELLADCLDHLSRQTVPHRVIVVDNGSRDGTLAMLSERFPEVEVVALDRNIGFGPAVNRAASASTGEAIVLVNNDVNVEPRFLSEIVEPLHDPAVGMVAGVLLEPAGGLIDAAGIEMDAGLGGYAYMGGAPVGRLDQAPNGLLGPCGGAAAYRRRAFEQVEGFDESIFVYSEDLDLALRMRAAGWRCELAPRATGLHLGSATLGARTVSQVSHAAWSRGYVLGRYRVGAGWLAAESMVALADALLLRSLVPVRGRYRGWRRGREQAPLTVPADSVSSALGPAEALRRRLSAAFPRPSARR